MDIFRRPFDTSGFVPRWSCGDWSRPLGWIHIVSDLLIFAAYFAIPVGLLIVLLRRRDLPFGPLLALFVAFILSCGVTHLLEAIIFYEPVYRLSGVAKALTAVISVTTAVVLIRALPSLLALPGLQTAVTDLRTALRREERMKNELAEVRDAMEVRSSEMTQRLRRIASAVSVARAVACRWDAQSGQIDWQIGFFESCRVAQLLHLTRFSGFSDLLVEEDLQRLHTFVEQAVRTNASLEFEGRIAGAPERIIRLVASPEPNANERPTHMIGMFRFI